jgi:hypothetical protein
VLGLWLLSQCTVETTTLDLAWRGVILGVGLGPSMGTFNMVVQAALPKTRLGVGTSATQFFRQIGGAVGVAVFGSIMTQSLAGAAAHAGLGKAVDLNALREMASHQTGEAAAGAAAAPHQFEMGVRTLVAGAVTHVFLAGAAVAVLAVVLTMLIPNTRLEHAKPHAPEPTDA